MSKTARGAPKSSPKHRQSHPERPQTAPYLRIAAELRARILAGTLPAGSRLPSTRDLARQQRVALATAAHALRTLVQQGLAEAIPRSGTRVASSPNPGPRAPGAEARLSLDRLVLTAIRIADDEGLYALSVRGLAAKLEVSPMSLYRHIDGRDELVEHMIVSSLSEERLPARPVGNWRTQLEVAARLQWRVFRRHPWLSRMLSVTRPKPLPGVIELTEWILRALEPTGLDAATRMRVHIVLHGFIQGMGLNLEEEARAAGDTGQSEEDWIRSQKDRFAALAVAFPAFGRFMFEVRDGFDIDFEELFEVGLGLLLDGVAARIAKRRRS